MTQTSPPDTHELVAWLNLTLPPGIGPRTQQHLLRAFGHPTSVFDAGFSVVSGVIGSKPAQSLFDGLHNDAQQMLISNTLDWCQAPGHHIITLADEHYPQRLLESSDPPCILYVNGEPGFLNRPAIGVVGSRNATPQGVENALAFSRVLADAGFTIISGLALGIDAAAHEGALRSNAYSDTPSGTIAIIGTGIDRVYPARNKKLAHLITAQGCIISEFPLGTVAAASNFPRRNRLIAGLSQACLVVEAAPASGSLITARLAGELGRDLFAIPGSIHAPQYKGCHALIKQGAKLVECAQDILDELKPQYAQQSMAAEMTAPTADPAHQLLLAALGHDPCTLDQLISRSGLTADAVLAMLTELCLEGVVTNLPGGRYQRLTKSVCPSSVDA